MSTRSVLVAYGSKQGSTAEIAEWIGGVLRDAGVARIAARLQARGHVTFGGRLSAEPPGLIARSMAKKFAGDFRNAEQVRAWAKAIARSLPNRQTASRGPISRKEP